jgi:hypothetical protein
MNAYQEIIIKLYEATGGKDNKSTDLKEIVKKAGLLGNYPNIYSFLCEEGWVAEDSKQDYVRITQWGVAEAKKAQTPVSEEEKAAGANAKILATVAKDLSDLSASYASSPNDENLKRVVAKFGELETALNQAKS